MRFGHEFGTATTTAASAIDGGSTSPARSTSTRTGTCPLADGDGRPVLLEDIVASEPASALAEAIGNRTPS